MIAMCLVNLFVVGLFIVLVYCPFVRFAFVRIGHAGGCVTVVGVGKVCLSW